jgi:ATP-binding cassette subfamily B protein
MPGDLNSSSWPFARTAELIATLARRAALDPRSADVNVPSGIAGNETDANLRQPIEALCNWLGLESEWMLVTGANTGPALRAAAPAVLRVDDRLWGLLEVRRNNALLIAADHSVVRVPLEALRAELCKKLEAPAAREVDQLLDECEVPARKRAKVRASLLRERLHAGYIGGIFALRSMPSVSFWRQMREAGLPAKLLALGFSHAAAYAIWIAAWFTIGLGALQGRLDAGWLLAWSMLILTMIPAKLIGSWSQGLFAIGFGGLLKQRLLYGALRLDQDEIRMQGTGQLLGRVIESDSVESLALNGGFLAFVSVFETLAAALVLAAGAGGPLHALLLAAWVALMMLFAFRFYRRRLRWTESRLTLTHELVERMEGHRTRLAQELRERWHEGEDESVERYIALSREADNANALLTGFAARGWLLVGILGIAPAFISGTGTPATLAIALGGVLLAYQAMRNLASGLSAIAGAAIAWRQVAPLFHAAARPREWGLPVAAETPTSGVILDARDIVFRHGTRPEPILRGLQLTMKHGDWVLLEGSSGGGKSTLAALISGLRTPNSGLLLLNGFDRGTLGGAAWRKRVASAPQYHENHVLTNTFAFNLLMGRAWPPTLEQLAEAEEVCRELGLGPLIERMPAGILQPVGEMGWQLSQGERSRLFMARALLQGGDLIVLDESFAALDPHNVRLALACVSKRAKTLLVVAHP